MSLTTDLLQFFPSLLATFIAIRELVPGRELRRAQEMVALEQAMAAAKNRNDAIYHGYRVHALTRVQSAIGNPFAPMAKAMLWGLAALLFFLMSAAQGAIWYVQISAMAAAAGSAYLAAANAGRHVYNSRTKQPEAAQAIDLSLAAARQDLFDATSGLPALKDHPDLATKALLRWKAMNLEQKLWLFGLLVALGVYWLAANQLEEALMARTLTRTEAIRRTAQLTCWATAAFIAYNSAWDFVTRKLAPAWLGKIVFWGGQAAMVASLFTWGESWLVHRLNAWRFEEYPNPRDFAMTLVTLVWAPTFLAIAAHGGRFVGWRKRRSASRKLPIHDSEAGAQPAEI